jgi:superoxide dismutase, Cu-Zn family
MAKAIITLSSIDDEIQGTLVLEQENFDAPTQIRGEVAGLTPGKHGLAIHVFGDISLKNGIPNVGEHFNPFGKVHGAPEDEERHVGGLGNIEANADGKAIVSISDRLVKLIGPQSVIGRSLVIAKREDDSGKGGHETSLTKGNAGEPIAWGVIGISA